MHVGLHKTGSTWLQQDVFPHLSVFTFGNFEPVLAALLGNLMSADDGAFLDDAFTAAVARYEASGSRLLLSHEGLSGSLLGTGDSGSRTARRLAAVLPGADVLLLTRNQPEMLLAAYAQYVNEGGAASFARFVKGGVEGPPFELASLEYDRLVACYLELFGREHVWVFPYEVLRASPAAFFDELRMRYGSEQTSISLDRRVNVSLSPAGLRLLRTWNRLFRASAFNPTPAIRALPGGRKVRNALQCRIDPAVRRLVPAAVESARLRGAHEIAVRFAESNTRLEQLSGRPLRELGYP